MKTITMWAREFDKFRAIERAARTLPVRVASYVTGGEWETPTGELVFAHRLPVTKIGKATVTATVDGEPCVLTPTGRDCQYAVTMTEL